MKKILLLLVLVPLAFGACSKGGGAVKEFTYFSHATDPGFEFAQTEIGKYMFQKTGLNVKFDFAVGDLQQKVGVMVASGDLPDLINADSANLTIINAGLAVELTKYFEKDAVNFKKNIDLKVYGGDTLRKLQYKGKLYAIPSNITLPQSAAIDPSTAFWVQEDVLKEAGYPKLTKIDDALALVKAYKAKHPTINGKPTIAFTVPYKDREYMLALQPAWLTGHPNDGIWNVDKVNGNWIVSSSWDTPEAKLIFQKYNDLYNSGFFDKEAFTISHDQFKEKMASGAVLATMAEGWEIGDAQALQVRAAYDNRDKADYKNRFYVGLPVTLDGRPAEYRYYENLLTGGGTFGALITTKAKDPEAIFKYIDTLVSKEVQDYIKWGVKDKDYSIDAKGLYYLSDAQRNALQTRPADYDKKRGIIALDITSVVGKWPDGNPENPSLQPSVFQASLTPAQKNVLQKYNIGTPAEMMPQPNKDRIYFPLWSTAPDKGTDEAIADNKLDTIRKEGVALLVSASPGQFEAVWNKYLADLKAIPNYDKLLQYRQNVVDTRMKEWQ